MTTMGSRPKKILKLSLCYVEIITTQFLSPHCRYTPIIPVYDLPKEFPSDEKF